jgi:alpha-tubulin suppressor-like RCC1 family protein
MSGGAGAGAGDGGQGATGGSAGVCENPGEETACYVDGDGDGFAALGASSRIECDGACNAGWTSEAPSEAEADCDDDDMAHSPATAELCNGGSDDCDTAIDEGAHSACVYDNAAGVCTEGACELGACTGDFRDCDLVPSNGCEQTLDTQEHCGDCGNECIANASCGEIDAAFKCGCDAPLIGDGSSCIGFGPAGVTAFMLCAINAARLIECFASPSTPAPSGIPTGMHRQIATSLAHACALRTDGGAACWGGNNADGQLNAPSDTFVQVSAGGRHSCGLQADGTATCWGISQTNPGVAGECGQSIAPSGTFRQIAAGGSHTCALRLDGSAQCWGAGSAASCNDFYDYGQSIPPVGERFIQLAAGASHTCGLREDQTLLCWGAGQSDEGETPHRGQSVPPASEHFTFVSAGAWHTCGVTASQDVRCWGAGLIDGASFDTGDGRQSRAPSSGNFLRVYAGQWHSCALNTAGSLQCWGDFAPTGVSGTWPVNP